MSVPDITAATVTDKWAERIAQALRKADRGQHEDYEGCDVGDGYVLVATDGHRAICRRGAATSEKVIKQIAVLCKPSWFTADQGLLRDALRRMKAAGSSSGPTMPVRLTLTQERLDLEVHDPADGTEAREWLPVAGAPREAAAVLDVRYLLSVIDRHVPVRVYLPPPDPPRPVAFEAGAGEYRALIMPIAGARNKKGKR